MLNSYSLARGDKKDKYIDILLLEIEKGSNYEDSIDQLSSCFLKTKCKKIQRLGMEFLYINGRYRTLQKLIIKIENDPACKNNEWARIYQIMLDAQRKDITALKLMNQIDSFEVDDPTLEILLEFSKVIVHFKTKNFIHLASALDKIDNLMTHCENVFLIHCFRRRIAQVMFYYYWSRNEVIIARKIAFELLNTTIDARSKVRLHAGLGLTYLFDTYEQGFYHLKKALDLSEKYQIKDLNKRLKNHTLAFYSSHFGRIYEITPEVPCERAHMEIAKGNKKEAIRLLNQIKDKTPFQYYYLGLAKEDMSILEKSYQMFLAERNDYFFSKLPFQAMQNLKAKI